MMTNEKALWVILILFIVGTGVYLTYNKLQQDIKPVASPSPSPAVLDFTITKTPPPATNTQPTPSTQQVQNNKQTQNTPQPQPQPTELPLARNKKLSQFPGILKPEILQNKKAIIQTKKGLIQLQIYPEASMAASNFMLLAANGFYDGLIFHRVDPGFVIQGGDPNGNGTGGPGYQFPDEAITRDYKKGIVAMANAGPNTNGSQFFIMLADHPELPKQYTIFGQVIAGQDIVEKIAPGDVMEKVVIQNLQ